MGEEAENCETEPKGDPRQRDPKQRKENRQKAALTSSDLRQPAPGPAEKGERRREKSELTRVVHPLETSFWVSDHAFPLCGILILHPEKKLNPNIWLLSKYGTIRTFPSCIMAIESTLSQKAPSDFRNNSPFQTYNDLSPVKYKQHVRTMHSNSCFGNCDPQSQMTEPND